MTAPLRLAVLTDLHVGGRFGQGFQNPFLTEDARLTAGATAARVREARPDLVLVSGDLATIARVEGEALRQHVPLWTTSNPEQAAAYCAEQAVALVIVDLATPS